MACTSTRAGCRPRLAAKLIGLAAGAVGRLAGQRPAQPGLRLAASTCSTGVRRGDRRLHPDRRRRCCGSACWCSLLYGGLLGLTYWGFTRTPTGFIPPQDKGYLLVNVQLPDSASLERTQKVMTQVEKIAAQAARRHAHRGHRRPVDPAERQRAQLRRDVRDARRLPPPAPHEGLTGAGDRRAAAGRAPGRDQATGWSTSSRPRRSTAWGPPAASRSWSRTAATWARRRSRTSPTGSSPTRTSRRTRSSCTGLFTSFRANTPWLYLDIDRDKAKLAGRLDRRAVQHAAGLPGLALRQRLQPLRPHLAGQRAGRRQLPQADRAT